MESSGEKGLQDVQPHRHPVAKYHQDATGRQEANGTNPSDERDRSTASPEHHNGG